MSANRASALSDYRARLDDWRRTHQVFYEPFNTRAKQATSALGSAISSIPTDDTREKLAMNIYQNETVVPVSERSGSSEAAPSAFAAVVSIDTMIELDPPQSWDQQFTFREIHPELMHSVARTLSVNMANRRSRTMLTPDELTCRVIDAVAEPMKELAETVHPLNYRQEPDERDQKRLLRQERGWKSLLAGNTAIDGNGAKPAIPWYSIENGSIQGVRIRTTDSDGVEPSQLTLAFTTGFHRGPGPEGL